MKLNNLSFFASKVIIIGFLWLSFSACKSSETKSSKGNEPSPDQEQGILGAVLWLEGNLMPGPDKKIPAGKPVEKEILIYKLTDRNQAEFDGQFFSNIKTDLVLKTNSDEKGHFRAVLPAGQYSLLVKEPSGLFANHFDGNGNINPVTVETGKFTEITLKIDYQAAY